MIRKILSFFNKKSDAMQVVIGEKKCRVAQPTALRYHKLTQLLELPDADKILSLQTQLDEKMKAYASNQSEEVRAEIVSIDKQIQSEMTKHSMQVQSLFRAADYIKLKEIVNTVCDNEVSEDDLKNCYEVQVGIAVDFFLALRLKTLNSITDTYATYARKSLRL